MRTEFDKISEVLKQHAKKSDKIIQVYPEPNFTSYNQPWGAQLCWKQEALPLMHLRTHCTFWGARGAAEMISKEFGLPVFVWNGSRWNHGDVWSSRKDEPTIY